MLVKVYLHYQYILDLTVFVNIPLQVYSWITGLSIPVSSKLLEEYDLYLMLIWFNLYLHVFEKTKVNSRNFGC